MQLKEEPSFLEILSRNLWIMDIERYFPEIENKYNCGIGGITSTMLLYFIDEGILKFKPKQLVYMIGTNDLGKTVMQSPKDIAINVKELVETVHYNLPECEIYVVSPLPCLPMHDYKHTPGVLRSNDLLKMIYKEFKKTIPYEYVTFINAYPTLCNKKGEPIEAYFEDGLHINHEGYVRYTNCLKEYIL